MRLIRPSWLGHTDENRTFEIYSLDVSSDNQRVVTGGLDSKVKVWSAAAIAQPDLPDTPKLLSSMAAHTGAVTAVKFSPDCRFIASGSDDRIVLVSELDASRQPRKREFGGAGTDLEESEVWTPRKRLVGHDNDVQDLAWSPDGQLLVSVGLDSAIIVWSGQTFEKLKRLDWHQSHVKGVTFDPANKFFVTCSDDRTARIVRYSRASPTELSFSVEAVVTQPFVDSPLTSYFRRCSWSPDGENIVCPNATNGPVPTVAVIDRGQWSTPVQRQTCLVGHEGTTEVAKFSPRMYLQDDKNEICVVATAGEDGKLAIWSTGNPRPLVVIESICSILITDIAWARSGKQIYISSLDGTVVLVEFDAGNLGEAVPLDRTLDRLAKYGNATDLMDIPQSVEQINIERRTAALEEGKQKKINKESDSSCTDRVAMESEGKTLHEEHDKKGSAVGEQTQPQDAQLSQQNSYPINTIGSLTPKQNRSSAVSVSQSQTKTQTPSSNDIPVRQRTSVTKDGRKRVTPMLLNRTEEEGVLQTPVVRTMQSSQFNNPASSQQVALYDRASTALPPGGINTLVIGNKRKSDDDPVPPKRIKEDTTYLRPVALNPSTTVSQVRLATPRVISHLSSDITADVVFEARNATKAGEPTRVTLISRGHVIFTDFIAEYASLLTGSASHWWAAATDTGVIYIYTPQGSRARAPLVLGAPLAMLESNGVHLCALTATGMLHAWNLETNQALFAPISIGPCLDLGQKFQESGLVRAPQVTQCWVTKEGRCLVSLSSGSVFYYDSELICWQRISESFWAYGSQFWDSTGLVASGGDIGPVTQSELRTNESALLKSGARGRQLQRQAANRTVQAGFQGFEQCVSIAHLGNRVAAARSLHSPELPKFVCQYVRKLAERGDRLKLGELFRSIKKDGQIDLLKLSLDTAGEFKGVQELVAEYESILN